MKIALPYVLAAASALCGAVGVALDVLALVGNPGPPFGRPADLLATLLVVDGAVILLSGGALLCAALDKLGLAWKLLFPHFLVCFVALVFVGGAFTLGGGATGAVAAVLMRSLELQRAVERAARTASGAQLR